MALRPVRRLRAPGGTEGGGSDQNNRRNQKQLRKTQRRIMLVATLCDRKLLPWTTGMEENRENRRLLLAALERILPALEAGPSEPSERPQAASEERGGVTTPGPVRTGPQSVPGGARCLEDRRGRQSPTLLGSIA